MFERKQFLPPLLTLISAICNLQSVQSAEPSIKKGDKLVTIVDAPVQVGTETLATVPAGTELVATEVQDGWVAVTVEQDGKEVSGWIDSDRLIVNPKRAFTRLTGRFKNASSVRRLEQQFQRMNRNGDEGVTLDEFLVGTEKPTLDDLNRDLEKQLRNLLGSAQRMPRRGTPDYVIMLGDLVGPIYKFGGWRADIHELIVSESALRTTPMTPMNLADEWVSTRDIRRSRVVQGWMDREHSKKRAQRAQPLFKWADKNGDGKLSLEEFKRSLTKPRQQKQARPKKRPQRVRTDRETTLDATRDEDAPPPPPPAAP